MPFARLRGGWRLAGPYLALVGAVALYLAYRFAFRPANSELLGVWLVVLALPWSALGVAGGAAGAALAVAVGVAINTWILFRLAGGRRA